MPPAGLANCTPWPAMAQAIWRPAMLRQVGWSPCAAGQMPWVPSTLVQVRTSTPSASRSMKPARSMARFSRSPMSPPARCSTMSPGWSTTLSAISRSARPPQSQWRRPAPMSRKPPRWRPARSTSWRLQPTTCSTSTSAPMMAMTTSAAASSPASPSTSASTCRPRTSWCCRRFRMIAARSMMARLRPS